MSKKLHLIYVVMLVTFVILHLSASKVNAQTLAFSGAEGFGRFTTGARGAQNPEVYIVTNLNDSGPGSFRDACSKQGRFIVFAISGIIKLSADLAIPKNTTIAGQTAPGEGIVLYGRKVSFSGSDNTIARYIRIRLSSGNGNSKSADASGIANGKDMILDHLSVTWGMDEVFSINWDSKGNNPDNITIQNSIIGQGLHRHNHSAGGLMQPSEGGKISLIRNLYSSNKTRNPKVKGINEFVNNVVYNWGNYGNTYGHSESGEAYIMGGDSAGESFVNIINNYFISGPSTRDNWATPFNRGNSNFNLYGSGNYFDNNKDGVLNGIDLPYDIISYPTGDESSLKAVPYDYPMKNPTMTAEQAYYWICDHVGASYPRRDQVDKLMISDLRSVGTSGIYVYTESDLPLANGGVGNVFSAPAPLDSDEDGIPDIWEDANGLNKNDKTDAVKYSLSNPEYLNIEVYINSLMDTPPSPFIIPPSNILLSSVSVETPSPQSTITIKWTDNSNDEDGFVIERSLDGVSYSVLDNVPANTITYQDNNGLPNVKYWYRIKAVNTNAESAYGAAVSILTAPIPTAPVKTSSPTPKNAYKYVELLSHINTGNLQLSWIGSANTTTYKIFIGESADNLAFISNSTTINYTISASSLVKGKTYYWRVDAENSKGVATGDIWSFRVMPDIPNGLVGYWSFDDILNNGNQITDSSPYENHGTLALEESANIKTEGKVGSAINFATATTNMDVINIPNNDQLYLSNRSFSISFWMKAPAAALPNSVSEYLLCKGSMTKSNVTGATGNRYNLEFKSKQLRFAIDNDERNKDELGVDGYLFYTNEWVHVVLIRDFENRKLKVYANGVKQGEKAITSAIDNIGEESALILGNIGELELLNNEKGVVKAIAPAPYKGLLDEFKIYNYVLTDAQIQADYNVDPLPIQASSPKPVNQGEVALMDRAELSWDGGFKTTSFKLYAGTSASNLTFVTELPVITKSYELTNLNGNTQYFWRVDAVNDEGTKTGQVWEFKTAAFPQGIVADWHLDATNGIDIIDNSIYQNNGTISNVNSYAWESGKLNNSLNLQDVAANSAIVVPHNESLKFDKNSFSVSLWVKASTPASTSSYILHKGTFAKNAAIGTTGKWYGVELKGDQIYFSVDDDINKSTATASSTSILNDTWVNLVFVRNVADKTLKIYKDGVQIALAPENSSSIANGIGGIESLYIANCYDLNAPFKGALDEVKFFNYALSQTEITNLSQGTLPVKLVDFTAKIENSLVKLRWSTVSEENNDKFIVEKSSNGYDFSFLKELKGKGVSNQTTSYTAFDNAPSSGTNYYKLVQYDKDGQSQIVGLSSVSYNLITSETIRIYPNPVKQEINVAISKNVSQAVISLISLDGKTVYERLLTPEDGIFKVNLLQKPKSGVYVLKVACRYDTYSSKLVVD
ncbi:hypothetical protein Pedsa_3724 [Pseudopedobacter saltans DSM 12145]|uniref:Fibronectin type-III domain-containing protein n=1 Tax=Pseudopedobacter saltans (strain ATCC 51119 / DSM 12145 / JCM 21818 / CCUG 39354 / LMG 10337 / NBRC 100064 / NCIMB 13643) TaxID=762903 RepID=F0S6C7_PSESL|nr:LamG-like jellyroll fold domain-containing protein [Pseudopedobacter saltans]ADY54253.1 hypothetical protein Pedsa_3724 [Pseudopedobacter saltans DSM 12145]